MAYERPELHFTPKKGWINDPNGLIRIGDRYHLFAQHYPDSTERGPIHWLHATSSDLLSWREEGIALAPDEMGTMFSGSAVQDAQGRIALLYTAHGEIEHPCIAFSTDGLRFEKYAGNPVLINPGVEFFRDPKVFWNDRRGCWTMALALAQKIEFYRSDDLINWRKTGEFRVQEDWVFECPDCFALTLPDGQEKWVLIAGLRLKKTIDGCRMRYWIGSFDGDSFTADHSFAQPLELETGYDSYAATSWYGTKKRLVMSWMSSRSHPLPIEEYCGCLSLVREMSLVETPIGLRLAQRPVLPAMRFSRAEPDGRLPSGACVVEIEGQGAFELHLKDANGQTALAVGCSEQNSIYTDRAISPDLSQAGWYNDPNKRRTNVARLRDGALKMWVIVDRWTVEIYADDGLYAHGLLVFAQGGLTTLSWKGEARAQVWSQATRITP